VLKITTGSLGEKGAGVFIQRLTQDTSQLATSLSTLIVVLSQFFEKIGILAAILIMNRLAFLVVAGILVIQIIIETVRTQTLKADDIVLRNAEERYTGLVSEMIHGAADVKLTNSEQAFEKELKDRIHNANGKRLKMWNRSAVFDISRMQLDSVGTYVFIMVLAFLLSQTALGYVGIWSAWPVGWTVAAVMSLLFYANGPWKGKRAMQALIFVNSLILMRLFVSRSTIHRVSCGSLQTLLSGTHSSSSACRG
jgi:ABC-type multidrug transport system fused ATPase/permease subunit